MQAWEAYKVSRGLQSCRRVFATADLVVAEQFGSATGPKLVRMATMNIMYKEPSYRVVHFLVIFEENIYTFQLLVYILFPSLFFLFLRIHE